MRLFKRRGWEASSNGAPQLVSLAPINTDAMDMMTSPLSSSSHHHHQLLLSPTAATASSPFEHDQVDGGDTDSNYADYQTVTALPARVVVAASHQATTTTDEVSNRKGENESSSSFIIILPSQFKTEEKMRGKKRLFFI